MVGENTEHNQQQAKKIYDRYTAAIVTASIGISTITPNVVKYISPEALDISSIAIANPIAYTVSAITLGAVAIDKAAKHLINFDLGLTKSIADALGAEKIIEKYNAKALENVISKSVDLDDNHSKAVESKSLVIEKPKEEVGYFQNKLKEERLSQNQKGHQKI